MYYFINLQIKHLDLGKTENKFYILGQKCYGFYMVVRSSNDPSDKKGCFTGRIYSKSHTFLSKHLANVNLFVTFEHMFNFYGEKKIH